MKTGKDIWNVIKDRFQDFEEEPPEMGWENISSKIKKDKGNNNATIYKVAGLVAILLITTLYILYTTDFSPPADKTTLASEEEAVIDNSFADSAQGALSGPAPRINESPSNNSTSSKKEKETTIIQSEQKPSGSANTPTSTAVESKRGTSGSGKEGETINIEPASEETKGMHLGQKQRDVQNPGEEEERRSSSIKGTESATAYIQKEDLEIKESSENRLANDALLPTKRMIKVSKKPALSFKIPMGGLVPSVIADAKNKEKSATEVEKENKRDTDNLKNEYHFQVFFSPRYSYRRIASNSKDDVLIVDIKNGSSFRQRFGYETGILLSRDLTSKLNINAGLSLVNLKESITYSYTKGAVTSVRIDTGENGQYIVIPIYENETATASSSYYYGGITLSSSYSFLEKKGRRFYLTFGTGVNLLVKGKTIVVLNGVENTTLYFPSSENPLEQMNFKLNLGLGYGHRLSENIELTVEPTLNYYLGSTFKEREPVGIKPYTLGLNIGLRF